MMVSNEKHLSLWPCIHSTDFMSWNISCTLCRISGAFILLISIFSLKFNIRFLRYQRHQNSLVLSLFLASFLVISISVPGVLVQLFTCHRLCIQIYCRIEGFISYLCGCLCMLTFVALSIYRYLTLCSNNSVLSYRSLTWISWVLSISFTFPLLFNYLNSYIPEGLGFHCSIDWQDQSSIGRIYILSSFMLMYFLPLASLIFLNVRAHSIIRHIYAKQQLNTICLQSMDDKCEMRKMRHTDSFGKNYVNNYLIQKNTDRKCRRMDYRFLRAIIFLVTSYIIAWTPYSILAILQLLDTRFIFQNAFLVTASVFVAKISVIVTPLAYISIMNHKSFKRVMFQ